MAVIHAEVGGAAQHDCWVAAGFQDVRAEFDRNLVERGEIGAAVAGYWRGEKVVDLWGGRRTPIDEAPWNEDTMAQRWLGSMTKAGSTRARRLVIEAAYYYRRGPAVGEALERRQGSKAPQIIHIAWRAQRRLNAR
ncbi:MAG TPA: hypothetical protein VFI54_03810 [Solirubrobacteraceae bacterium]|nr:hypothetical protein [Solirubrobacteraceae bacterium]